ncbi:MAG: S8 family serine peptidase [Vulcanimicrobiota bacterium]
MQIRPNQLPNSIRSAARPVAPAAPAAVPTQAAAVSSESAQLGSVPPRIANLSTEAVQAVQADIGQTEYVEGEVIVKLKPTEQKLFGDFAAEYGGKVIEEFDIPSNIYKSFDGDLIRIKLPAGITTAEAIAAMKEDGRVSYAESNDIQQFYGQEEAQEGVPNDLHQNLWGFRNTGQTGGTAGADASIVDGWKVTTGNNSAEGPLIAIIDSGADLDHPDLVGNLWVNPGEIPGDGIDNDGNGVIDDVHGYHAADNHGSPDDQVGHGTHVAGTIGAVGNNAEGVTGVMQKARLMPIRIDSNGSITTDGVVRALMYATKMGADITNNSWGGSRLNKAIEDAFKAAPALHLAAAGNNGTDADRSPSYPMAFDMPNMISVAATDHNDRKASFSNYGLVNVDVAAPGKDIYSTRNGGGYQNMSGTSMATPFTTGVAGLIQSAYPDATPTEIKERLIYGSDAVEALKSTSISGGRVNAANALENDTVAPGAPNDFAAHDTNSRGTTLRWTSTGDDKWSGQSSATELRVSTEAINLENFSEARAVSTPTPGETGNFEKVAFNHQPSTTPQTYHFAMKVVDNVGNRSEMRTTSVTVPAATVAYQNGFDAQEASWSPEGNWGRVAVEGRGMVWTDSPDGGMTSESSTGITSPTISLKDTANNLLQFDAKYNLGYSDKVSVQVSTDGENWTEASTVADRSNRSSDWASHSVDLSAFDGQDVKLRFQLDAGRSSRPADGFYLDNLALLGDPRA